VTDAGERRTQDGLGVAEDVFGGLGAVEYMGAFTITSGREEVALTHPGLEAKGEFIKAILLLVSELSGECNQRTMPAATVDFPLPPIPSTATRRPEAGVGAVTAVCHGSSTDTPLP